MALARMHSLTRLRFWLALWVVLFHFRPTDGSVPGWAMRVFEAGYLGVPFFFVLSGFVLAAAYPRPTMTDGYGRRRFALRRFARLYPAFAAAVLAFAAIQGAALALGTETAFDPGENVGALPLTLAGLHAWSPDTACAWNCPSWSLSVEFAFYLLFPLLILIPARARLAAFGVATAYTAFMVVQDFGLSREFFLYHPTLHIASFLLGILLWESKVAVSKDARRLCAVLMLPAMVGLVVLNTWSGSHPVLNSIGGWFAVIPTIIAMSTPTDAADLSLHTRLGDASYSLYIWHIPVHLGLLGAAARAGIASNNLFFATFAAATVVASSLVLHRWLERPAEKWILKRWGAHAGARPASPDQPAPAPLASGEAVREPAP